MEMRINHLAQEADTKEQDADDLKLTVQRQESLVVNADREQRLRTAQIRKSYKKALDAALTVLKSSAQTRRSIGDEPLRSSKSSMRVVGKLYND